MNMRSTKAYTAALVKLPAVMVLLLVFLVVSLVLAALPGMHEAKRRMRIDSASFFSRIVLVLFRVRIRIKHRERFDDLRRRRCLIVANHVSYIDVLALSSVMPAVFITSVELGDTPLLGLLARSAGSLFVERRKASGLKREIEAIAGLLRGGFPVALFPEATTSNGDHVHPFKRSLFDAAVASSAAVFPVCLRYTAINGQPVTPANRDSLYYYGGVTFLRHFPRFLALRSVELEILPQHSIRVHANASRKELSEQAYDVISRTYLEGRQHRDK